MKVDAFCEVLKVSHLAFLGIYDDSQSMDVRMDQGTEIALCEESGMEIANPVESTGSSSFSTSTGNRAKSFPATT